MAIASTPVRVRLSSASASAAQPSRALRCEEAERIFHLEGVLQPVQALLQALLVLGR